MTKEISFANPPEGHIGLLVYDDQTDKWYAALGDSDGHIILEVSSITLPDGLATSEKQLPNDHDINVTNMISGFATSLKQLANDHDVNVSNVDLEVFQDTPGSFLIGQHQYDGEAWRKSNLLFGYNERYGQEKSAAIPVAGNILHTFTAVGAGEVFTLEGISVVDQTGASTATEFTVVYSGVGGMGILFDSGQDQWTPSLWTGKLTLKQGDYVKVRVYGTEGDTVVAIITGYKMDIAM